MLELCVASVLLELFGICCCRSFVTEKFYRYVTLFMQESWDFDSASYVNVFDARVMGLGGFWAIDFMDVNY